MISNPIIEFALENKKVKSNHKFAYVDCFTGRQVMQSESDISWISPTVFDHEIIIFPCHSGSYTAGHWTLIILDRKNNEFYYFDSAKNVSQQNEAADEAFLQFGKFLNNYKKLGLKTEYKNIYQKYQTQPKRDTYNCGIFLLYFVDQFLDAKDRKLNPKDYRIMLKNVCLKESESMQNICRKCFKEAGSQIVQFSSCLSWYHVRCLNIDFKTVSLEGIQFNCKICI